MMVPDRLGVEWYQRVTVLGSVLALLICLLALMIGTRVGEGRRMRLALEDAKVRVDTARAWTRDRGDLRVITSALEYELQDHALIMFHPGNEATIERKLRARIAEFDLILESVEIDAPRLGPELQHWPFEITIHGNRGEIPRFVDRLHRQRRLTLIESIDVELESFYSATCRAKIRWSFITPSPIPQVSGALVGPYLLPSSTQALLSWPDETSANLPKLRLLARELETLWRDLLEYESLLRRRDHVRRVLTAIERAQEEGEAREVTIRTEISQLSTRLDRSALGRARLDIDGQGVAAWTVDP